MPAFRHSCGNSRFCYPLLLFKLLFLIWTTPLICLASKVPPRLNPISVRDFRELQPWFPNLDRKKTFWTSGATDKYNCIAWAVGHTDTWINPPEGRDPVTADRLFQLYRLQRTSDSDSRVRLYSNADEFTHADRQDSRKTLSFYHESKIGGGIQIYHPNDGLGTKTAQRAHPSVPTQSSVYGDPMLFYEYRAPSALNTSQTEQITRTDDTHNSTTVDRVVRSLRQSFHLSNGGFEPYFTNWKNTWFRGTNQFQQSSKSRAQGFEWQVLLDYCQQRRDYTLPLIVRELRQQDNVFAIELYNAVQTDPAKKVPPTDVANYYDLSKHAARIREMFGRLIVEFNANVTAWQQENGNQAPSTFTDDTSINPSSNSTTSSSNITAGGVSAYRALVSMGTAVIPLIMERYANDQGERLWPILLAEITHYQPPDNGNSSSESSEFGSWKSFYETGSNGISSGGTNETISPMTNSTDTTFATLSRNTEQ